MAKTGDPNGAGATPWPAFTEAGDQNIILDLTVSTETNRKKVDCDFWDSF
jgi:carboxylesterase type B